VVEKKRDAGRTSFSCRTFGANPRHADPKQEDARAKMRALSARTVVPFSRTLAAIFSMTPVMQVELSICLVVKLALQNLNHICQRETLWFQMFITTQNHLCVENMSLPQLTFVQKACF
jgi:hypothetical protein